LALRSATDNLEPFFKSLLSESFFQLERDHRKGRSMQPQRTVFIKTIEFEERNLMVIFNFTQKAGTYSQQLVHDPVKS
jgi:hypothetical protein